jgi:hypothetical protein
MTDSVRLAEGADPSRYHPLYHFAKAAKQADNSVCFCGCVHRLALLP